MTLCFEQGPIRPPSEAASLLLRLTRNCTWNKCVFCPTYKGQTFSRRSLGEIKKDIDTVKEMIRLIREYSLDNGFSGAINRKVLEYFYTGGNYNMFHVAMWLHDGAKTVFFQDANSLIMKTADLIEILKYLKEQLPTVERVTSYARSDTLLRKSVDELAQLGQAGLSRIHVGMESGSDEVLKFMDKGVTSQQHVDAGKRVKEAGISLCEYVLLGLGGEQWSQEHALSTAQALNAINPDFIRFRSLAVTEEMPLYQKVLSGEFKVQDDAGVTLGQKMFIERLEGIQSSVISDHSLNLLEEVTGKLPEDKPAMLGVLDRFLELPPKEKQIFILGKRLGMFHRLSDLHDTEQYRQVEQMFNRLDEGQYAEVIAYLKGQLIC
ncbi:MAG: radical SAM protein [Peptococcaceae bacterium]|nr:radical SAM protein [Peptococcaceae bacterium]